MIVRHFSLNQSRTSNWLLALVLLLVALVGGVFVMLVAFVALLAGALRRLIAFVRHPFDSLRDTKATGSTSSTAGESARGRTSRGGTVVDANTGEVVEPGPSRPASGRPRSSDTVIDMNRDSSGAWHKH